MQHRRASDQRDDRAAAAMRTAVAFLASEYGVVPKEAGPKIVDARNDRRREVRS